jgi:hypothetical protein
LLLYAMASFVVRNGHILSCASGSIVENHWFQVDAGRIKAIGRGEPPDATAAETTVDLEGRTVLPGLADSHPAAPKGSSELFFGKAISCHIMILMLLDTYGQWLKFWILVHLTHLTFILGLSDVSASHAPGHLHVFALGKATTSVNLDGCTSMSELQNRARQHLETGTGVGGHLEGLGWDQDLLGRTPSRLEMEI